ncbi:MAG: hypothetical protein MI863_10520 [Desulfobacterales bacterium]|nr:hypothetical protein [Desulfobacterales bacterium]
MEPFNKTSFEALAEKFLGSGFPRHLAGALSMPKLPPDARDVIRRVLRLMKRSGYPLADFNPVLIRWLASTIPGILPSAWGGNIPPITVPGRHRKLDGYIAGQDFPASSGQRTFVDIGCGFPPVTTADTAYRLPEWQIYGVDRSFADYVLYDTNGHYACFNGKGEFLYFQPSTGAGGKALYSAPGRTKERFRQLFAALFPLLRNADLLSSETVERDGNRLIHNHITDFGTANLKFIESDIMDLEPIPATAVRCMNVLMYFTRDIQNEMLGRIGQHLENGGLLIAGTNSFGIQARYAVYKKDDDNLVPGEFAFSLDNLGHLAIMPWFTIHDNDPETALLAELSRTIRSFPPFWAPFSRHLDQLLEYHGFCRRGADGFLYFPEEMMLPDVFLEKNALLWREMQEKGYGEGAVDTLGKAGYYAWINPAGDIAIRPPDGTFVWPG